MNYLLTSIHLEFPKDLIQVERNGYIFQMSKDPFCRVCFKGKKKQVVAYKYYLGMHMIAGHGNMDALEKIRVGEKVAWEESDVLKQSYTDVDLYNTAYSYRWLAQPFIASSDYILSSVELKLFRAASAVRPGIITVSIRLTDVDGFPTGNDLCVGTTDGDDLLLVAEWRNISFNDPIILTSGIEYSILIRVTESIEENSVNWVHGDSGVTEADIFDVSLDAGKTWIEGGVGRSHNFKTYTKDGSAPNRTITINKPNIFGGDRKEGGVQGNVDLMFGDITQTQNNYLKARLDSDIPAYRGLFSAVLNQVYIGTSPYLKPWSFFLKRVCKRINGDDQWYKEKAVIRAREPAGDDLNPAHIIRECLVDSEWGLGWSTDDVDDAAWKEVANTLYDEGFGLSMLWDQVIPIEDFVDDILSCIAGMLYQDLATGKWVLVLTRDPDYDNPYDYSNTGDNDHEVCVAPPGTRYLGQTFTTSKNYSCNSIKIKIFNREVGDDYDVRVELQDTDLDGFPNGNVIASGLILNADIPIGEGNADWVECIFSHAIELTVNTRYALVIYHVNGLGYLYWRLNTQSPFTDGNYEITDDSGTSWDDATSRYINDFMFEIYAGGDIETFDEDDIIDVEEFTRPSYGEIVDLVEVKFWDKLTHKSRSTEARDIALIEKQGGVVIPKIHNYQGICDTALANRVAERELKLATSMLAGIRLRCTRKMSHLKPNDIFKFSWPDLGVTQMILRVLNVNYGNLDRNEVYLVCVEDSFSTAATIYGDAPASLWEDSINAPEDITNRRLVEIPYWSLCNHVIGSLSLVAALDNETGFICVVAGKPTEDAFDYDILTRLSDLYSFKDAGIGNNSFTPIGILTNSLAMNAEDTWISLSSESDLDLVEINTYAIIDDEIVKILDTDTTLNRVQIARGILDTAPAVHSADAIIYFMGLNYGEIDAEYTIGDTPSVKLLPRTAEGSLTAAEATVEPVAPDVFTLAKRMIRPYLPGSLKFNDESYPQFISSGAHGNKIAIIWNHRDRTDAIQLNSLVEHSDSSIGPESGVTYVIKIYDSDNVLQATYDKDSSPAAETPFDYTEAMEISDCGSLQDQLRFVIYAIRDGHTSFQSYDITIRRAFRGTSDAESSLGGWLIPYFDGRNSILPNNSAEGFLNVLTGLGSSVVEISGTGGALGSIQVETKFQGSAVGVSGADGTETGIVV